MNKHTHQYIRIRIGIKVKRYEMKCAVAGCPHHIRPELAVGRFSICNRCFNEFVLTPASLQLARPHCIECTESKDKSKPNLNAIKDKLEDLLV